MMPRLICHAGCWTVAGLLKPPSPPVKPFLHLSIAASVIAFSASAAFSQNQRHSPTKPLAAGEKAASVDEAKSRIKKTGENEYELSGITFNSATHAVRIPAEINMDEGNIEYALVHENGKTHESLFRTKVSAFDLNVALLLSHYEPSLGEIVSRMSRPDDELKKLAARPMEKPGAERLKISVTWKDDKGASHNALIRDWIRNDKADATMTADHWAYSGSELHEGTFEADREGSYIAVYLDFLALINSIELGNADDKTWVVDKSKVPAVGTPVTLIIEPAAPATK